MYPHQAAGVEWFARHPRGLLADEAGLGKSRTMLEASRGETLIVAPAMVLDGGNWDDQLNEWLPAQERARFTQAAYSQLHKPQYHRRWDTVILDEAHYIKNRKAKRTRLVFDVASRSPRVFSATGTPIPNWSHELFTLLQLQNPTESKPGRRFGSYWRWVETWFDILPSRYSQYGEIGGLRGCRGRPECAARPASDPCEHYVQFVQANLGSNILLRRRDDVLKDLPPLTEVRVDVKMGPQQRRAYSELRQTLVTDVDDVEIQAWSMSSRHVLLDRMTTGLHMVSSDVELPMPPRADDAKLARLAYDLASRSAPTLVMAHYRDTVDACVAVARQLGLKVDRVHGGVSKADRLRVIRQFQSGQLDVLVGSLETLAEGLTLTRADMVIFVEKSWKPSRNEQALRRVHRIGQDRPVTALDYVTLRSVDAGKRRLLAAKTDQQIRTLSAAELVKIL